jgi:hypothetical protein
MTSIVLSERHPFREHKSRNYPNDHRPPAVATQVAHPSCVRIGPFLFPDYPPTHTPFPNRGSGSGARQALERLCLRVCFIISLGEARLTACWRVRQLVRARAVGTWVGLTSCRLDKINPSLYPREIAFWKGAACMKCWYVDDDQGSQKHEIDRLRSEWIPADPFQKRHMHMKYGAPYIHKASYRLANPIRQPHTGTILANCPWP